MACHHPKARQGSGDRVCTDPTCGDCAHADLVTSCCLADPEGEGSEQVCSECGTPCGTKLTAEQATALQTAADVLAGHAAAVSPDEPGRAWDVLAGLLRQMGIATPSSRGD